MKASEIINEDSHSGKYTNINSKVALDGIYFSQNIPTIQVRDRGGSDLDYMIYRLKAKAPTDFEAFKTTMAQTDSQTAQTLLQLTEAYYATAYAVLTQANDALIQSASELIAKHGISRNDPF